MIYSVTCPQCNEENAGNELRCVKCGASLMGLPRQAKQSPTSVQPAAPILSNQEQVALVEQKIKTGNLLTGGANSFFWIAGLSLVNSAAFLAGTRWNFLIGLGITQFIDGVSIAMAREVGANGATIVRGIAFVMDVGIAGIFVVFGFLARKRYKWAFIVGMILYALDGLIFLMVPDFISIGFHLFILYGLYLGLKSITQLRSIEQAIAT